jgi:hypothetical protein
MQKSQPDRWSEQRWKGTPLRSFDSDGLDAIALRVAPHLIEKDRLAYTAQPDHHHAFGRATKSKPLQPDCNVAAYSAATG